jgi:two-component system response regulator (stage 0 sporulation protein F)
MGEKLDVLVVDDQPGVRQLLGIIVTELGDKVREAQNGKEAVDQVRKWQPDLVIMDIRMPVMGGVDALEKIKTLRPDLPVVMMTAYGSEEALEDLRRKGAVMCLTKPFDVEFIRILLEDFRQKKDDNDIVLSC